MKHVITIHLVFEIPDDDDELAATQGEAIERAVESLLDDGTLSDWILDAAGDIDGTDNMEDVESVAATCTNLEEVEETEPEEASPATK